MRLKYVCEKIGHVACVYSMTYDESRNIAYVGDGNGYVVAWDVDTSSKPGKVVAVIPAPVYCLAFRAENQMLIAGDMHGHIYMMDTDSCKIERRIIAHKKGVFAIKIYGNKTISCGADGYITIWNSDLQPTKSLKLSSGSLRSMEIFDDIIYVGDSNGYIFQLTVENFDVKSMWKAHESTIFTISITHAGIFTGSKDAHISHWSFDGDKLHSTAAHWYTVNHLLIFKDNLISLSRDKKIRIWDIPTFELKQSIDFTMQGHIRSVNCGLLIEDKRYLFTSGDDKVVKLWSID